MNCHEKLYSVYVSAHTSQLYGEATLEGIKKQFPVWKSYYGRFLPKDKKAKILDVGCGNGGFVYWLNQRGYNDSFGIDISREQIDVANSLGIQNVECADLLSFLKDKRDSYDLIFARDIIEHFNKDEILNILRLIYISLKKKGEVIIHTSNCEGPFATRYRYRDFTHEISFGTSSLNQILGATGFLELSFYPTGPVPKGVKSAVRFLLWKMIDAIIRFYILVETGSGRGIFTQTIIAAGRKSGQTKI